MLVQSWFLQIRRKANHRHGGLNVACRCYFFAVVGALGGCCRLSRFQARSGDWSSCRLSCAGRRSISCTMVHRACAVRGAGAIRGATPTDAWWKHAFPRTCLGGAYSVSRFYKPTFGLLLIPSFLEIRKSFFATVNLPTFAQVCSTPVFCIPQTHLIVCTAFSLHLPPVSMARTTSLQRPEFASSG